DRIHIRPRQHLAIIARDEDILAEHFIDACEPSLINIAGRHQFGTAGKRRLHVAGALTPSPNDRDLHLIVSRPRPNLREQWRSRSRGKEMTSTWHALIVGQVGNLPPIENRPAR